MENKEIVRNGLQTIVTQLSQQADGHVIQARVFASMGFTKLADKYEEHATEERGYVKDCIDRLLDLGYDVALESKEACPVIKDPVEWVKHDLAVSREGLAALPEIIEAARTDYSTYDILVKYYKDEEEDMYWGEQQLDLIACIGKENWLIKQL